MTDGERTTDGTREELALLARSVRAHVAAQERLGVLSFPLTPAAQAAAAALEPLLAPAGAESASGQTVGSAASPRGRAPAARAESRPRESGDRGTSRPPSRASTAAAAAPSPPAPLPGDLAALPGDLAELAGKVSSCELCGLHRGRTHPVFGEGASDARLLFVGEGPGFDEDRQGRPFVGRSGQLLDRMIGAMGLQREAVYIANVVKCRPPGNRAPLPDEMAKCLPYLHRQIEAIEPEVLVLLGATALRGLFPEAQGIMRERGRWRIYRGIDVMPTFHPAYLLRNPRERLSAWEDLKDCLRRLDLPIPQNPADK